MRLILIFGVLGTLLLNLYSCKTGNSKGLGEKSTNYNHPVRVLYMSSIEAFNQGKLDSFLGNFDSDIRMYGTDGTYFGIDALRERFADVFKQFPNVRMEILELDLEILSDEIVLVDFKWKVYPMGQGPSYSGLGSGIYLYQDDNWTEILEAEKVTHIDKELARPE
ncbi:nuclear transport factor 2 family protein [Flavobacteriaceae bacterium TP-CH-4]|uniref:Nuclear transport factor 2 family protein n=1 Tax=Pelagihabitans pacificus TaxID=2696054 RepID=A0A967B1A6_9FLAO|nr:nuclear transport factor 2 family protein [Pelagihabitans pacificus]NHF61272.1 nuclear transport factor 2 family protein [Pelagihabitans pacificus]